MGFGWIGSWGRLRGESDVWELVSVLAFASFWTIVGNMSEVT